MESNKGDIVSSKGAAFSQNRESLAIYFMIENNTYMIVQVKYG